MTMLDMLQRRYSKRMYFLLNNTAFEARPVATHSAAAGGSQEKALRSNVAGRFPFSTAVFQLKCAITRHVASVLSLQSTRDRLGDIAADERFAEHLDDPCGVGSLAEL
jgi:hypothetical protein